MWAPFELGAPYKAEKVLTHTYDQRFPPENLDAFPLRQ